MSDAHVDVLDKSAFTWSEKLVQGFTVAAIIADDPFATKAEGGLAPAIKDAVTRLSLELGACDAGARRERIRALTALLSPSLPEEPVLAPRAQALLARTVPKRVGRRWLDAAPAPRPGFRPESILVGILKRIALQKAQTRRG